MEDMIRNIGEDSYHQAHIYDLLKDDLVTELYHDYSGFTRLSRQEIGGLIKFSLNSSSFCMK